MKKVAASKDTIGSRSRFNRKICVKIYSLLGSEKDASLAEATIWSVYLIEQVIKAELSRTNPLLIYDNTKSVEPILTIKLAAGFKDGQLRTISLDLAFKLFLALHPELKNVAPNFQELQKLRNELIHGCFDFDTSKIKLKEVITDNLDSFNNTFVSNFGHTFVEKLKGDYVTSKRILSDKYLKELKTKIDEHHKNFLNLNRVTVRTLLKRSPDLGPDIDIVDTIKCPACSEKSLDEIVIVEYDWSPDGGQVNGTTYYQCRVCGISLSSYEFTKIKDNPEISYVLNGDEGWYRQERLEEYLGYR